MEHNKLMGAILFGVLLCVITLSPSAEGCSCMPQHPQTAYCNADYVIVARILRNSVMSKPHLNTYKIDIKKSYKMSEKSKYYLKEGRIMTPKSDAMCGTKLEIGKIYVIAGRGPTVTLCNYVKAYRNMSTIERRGFAGLYRNGCKCEVVPCFSRYPGACPEDKDSCIWHPFGQCETKHSVCVRKGRASRCHWRYTPAYTECISEP